MLKVMCNEITVNDILNPVKLGSLLWKISNDSLCIHLNVFFIFAKSCSSLCQIIYIKLTAIFPPPSRVIRYPLVKQNQIF